jgi:hypothetical protein
MVMRNGSIYLVIMLFGGLASTGSSAQQPACKDIQDPAARLACFDKVPAAPAAVPAKPKPPAKPPADANRILDGGWAMRKSKDAMTDKVDCIISPANNPSVQVSQSDLYISYKGRDGVQGFTHRIDDGSSSPMQLPTEIERQVGLVHISGAAFNQILTASRLRVETVTLVAGLGNEDLQLTGMRRLYARMPGFCR